MPAYPDLVPDQETYEPDLRVSRLVGLTTEMGEAFKQVPLIYGLTWLTDEYIKHFGGTDAYKERLADEKESFENNADIINRMPPGFLSGTAKLAGFIIPNALDPINWIAGLGAERIIGSAGARLASKLSLESLPTLGRIGIKAPLGFAEGAAATAPLAVSTTAYLKHLDQPVSFATPLSLMAQGGLFGMALRGLFGFKPIINATDDRAISAVGIAQMNKGKKLDLDLFIKDALNRANEEGTQLAPEEMSAIEERLRPTAETIDAEVSKTRATLRGFAKRGFTVKPSSASEIMDLYQDIRAKPDELRTADDKAFLKTIPKTLEFQRAAILNRTTKESWNADDINFMQDFLGDKESELLKSRLEIENGLLKQHTQNLNQLKETDKNFKTVQLKTKYLEESTRRGEDRLKELNKMAAEPNKVKATRIKLANLETQKVNFDRFREDTAAHMELLTRQHPPVNSDDVRHATENFNTWKGDLATDTPLFNKMEDEASVKLTPEDEALELAQANVSDLRTNTQFEAIDAQMADDLDEMEKRENEIASKLNEYVKCEGVA